MRAFTYSFLSLVSFFILSACSQYDSDHDNQTKIDQANQLFSSATKAAHARENWEALSLLSQAQKLYEAADDPGQYMDQYLLHRQQAVLMNREKMYNLAAEYMGKALLYLDRANIDPDQYSATTERVSSLRYKATYLRRARKFEASNDILFRLLESDTDISGLYAQLKNQIGLNYLDLFDYQQAFDAFDNVLKISDLDPKMKAHYLQNRAHAAFNIGHKTQAFADMSQAVGINETLGRDLYSFATLMDLGEMYLEESNYYEAVNNFDQALASFENINTDPDLFKIYNLKWAAAKALELPDANYNKRLYDSLNHQYQANLESFNANQELALFQSRVDNYEQTMFERLQTKRYLLYWLSTGVVLLVVFILVLLAFKKKRSYQKVLQVARSK